MAGRRESSSLTRREALVRALAAGIVATSHRRPGRAAETATAETTTAAKQSSPLPDHITPETAAAIERGLDWLAARQQPDGGFGKPGTYARNVGICGLAGLAFLSYGGARGRYAQAVRSCTDYLLSRSRADDGFIVEEVVKTHAPMYGHGYAVTYLGQVCGEDKRPEVSDVLRRGVELIVKSQATEGGWRYNSDPEDADVSVSTCQLMALYSARQAGVATPTDVIARGLNFVRRCQNPDGGFRYRPQDPPKSLFPRSAAAVATMCAYGWENDVTVRDGRRYLAGPFKAAKPDAHAEYFYYGTFYAAHAAHQAGRSVWDQWYPPARDEFLRRRTPAGHWGDLNIGDEYATAMALIVLQFPYETLPLFHDE